MPKIEVHIILGLSTAILALACTGDHGKETDRTSTMISWSLVDSFPHDVQAFTQGLVVADGKLFESTGGENSWIAEVDLISGMQHKKVELSNDYFGEGICVINRKMYQLTWKNQIGFIYDTNSFVKSGEFHFQTEGWGITNDQTHIFISNGTDKIFVLDTVLFECKDTIYVSENGKRVKMLNELEFIDGYIYANQWQTNYVLKINPRSGNVEGKLDFSSLATRVANLTSNANVLNGIAYEPKSKILLITGKLWPILFAIKLSSNKP